MQALILAGGKGTRLRPLTVYTPKPIVPVVNRPLILYQIDILKKAGITDITLSLSYQPDKIEHLLGNGSEYGVNLQYITESSPLGTGGAYKFAASSSRDAAVVFNGDILTNLDVQNLIDFHRSRSSEATLALALVKDPTQYGLVELAGDSSITAFTEKPKAGALPTASGNTINAGVYVLEPSILDAIDSGTNKSFEYDVFPELLRRGIPFFGYVMENDYWLDIGTPSSYLLAHHDYLAGNIQGFEARGEDGFDLATHAEIDNVSLIAKDCVIKPGARVINSVIGPGVHIEEKALVSNSVIWAHTRVSTSAEINAAIIGRSCHVGRNAVVSQGSVLGDKTTLTDYTKV